MILLADLWAGFRRGLWILEMVIISALAITVLVATPWQVYAAGIPTLVLLVSGTQALGNAICGNDPSWGNLQSAPEDPRLSSERKS